MKALIILGDSVIPEYIFENKKMFPNLCKLIDTGASSAYSAYVQKGYEGSYSTLQNLISISTGLEPKEHGMTQDLPNKSTTGYSLSDVNALNPLWKVLNDNNISVGMSGWCIFSELTDIFGYVVAHSINTIDAPTDIRTVSHKLLYKGDVNHPINYFGNEIVSLYPKTLKQQGYSFEQLKNNNDLAWEAVEKYHFQDSIESFTKELNFFYNGIVRTQNNSPVDVVYFYTPTPDLIAHSCMYCDDNDVLIRTYQLLDEFVGKLRNELQPEYTVFLSDHGMQNFKDLVNCSDPSVQREAFAARDDVIWLPNSYIAFEAHNGALLFTAHALKGIFIASGKDIKNTIIEYMRTMDVYPTILEMLGCKIPAGRSGFVADIFSRPLINHDISHIPQARKRIALIQTHGMSIMDIVINELYIENRLADIIIVGEKNYEEIFLNNPRVSGFVAFEQYSSRYYDEVYCGFYNDASKLICHIRVE